MTQAPLSTIFDEPHYVEARRNRMANLLANIDAKTIAGKRVLELGCGAGDLGAELVKLGADVLSVDAVQEHLRTLKERYPDRKTCCIDLERFDLRELGQFDAILGFGLLYHLATPTIFLRSCADMAPELWMETVVQDRATAVCEIVIEEGPDQAFSGFGCRPSPAWLEQAMRWAGYSDVRDISSARANWGGPCPSIYDWTPRDEGQWFRDGSLLRKMYVATRRNSA